MQLSTPAFLFSGLLSLCLFISGFLLLLPLSFCPSLYMLISLSSASSSSSSVLSLVLPHSWCRPLSFVILCFAASGSGGWLLKTVKTMVNASSRLYAFVRWVEFASPMLLVFIFYHLQFWDEGTKTMVGLILVSVSFLCFFSVSRFPCYFFLSYSFSVPPPLFFPVHLLCSIFIGQRTTLHLLESIVHRWDSLY